MSDYVTAGLLAISMALPPGLALLTYIWRKQHPTGGFGVMVILILLFVLSIGALCGVAVFGMGRFHFDEEGELWLWAGIAVVIAISAGAIADANGVELN